MLSQNTSNPYQMIFHGCLLPFLMCEILCLNATVTFKILHFFEPLYLMMYTLTMVVAVVFLDGGDQYFKVFISLFGLLTCWTILFDATDNAFASFHLFCGHLPVTLTPSFLYLGFHLDWFGFRNVDLPVGYFQISAVNVTYVSLIPCGL